MTGSAATPVSTQVTMTVPAAKVAPFEGLLREVITTARGFQGHIGVDVLRPEGGGTYQIMFRYSSRAEHKASWVPSSDSGSWRKSMSCSTAALTPRARRRRLGGLVRQAGLRPPAPPRRWKMAVITLGALYPIVPGLLASLRSFTGGWPLPSGCCW